MGQRLQKRRGTASRGGDLSILLEMVNLGAELVGGVGRASQPEPEVVAVPAGRTGARASRRVGSPPARCYLPLSPASKIAQDEAFGEPCEGGRYKRQANNILHVEL